MKKEFKNILLIFLSWRVFLFDISIFSYCLIRFIPSYPHFKIFLQSSSLPEWVSRWGGFDGIHYLTIATEGYFGIGLIQAFFPLFPLLLRGLSILFKPITSGLLLSNSFTLALFYFFWKFASKLVGKKDANFVLASLILFPASLFLGAVYNESLFILLIVLSFLFAFKKKWILAGILAGLASATRVVGVLMVPALLIEWWFSQNSTKQKSLFKMVKKLFSQPRVILMVLLGSLGLILYMIYLSQTYHDPFYFLTVQNKFGAGRQTHFVLLPQVIWRSLKILITARPIDWKYYTYVQDFGLSLLAMIAFGIGFKKVRPSVLIFSILAFLVPTLTGTFSSMPRYLLPCLAIFLILPQVFKSRLSRNIYLIISTILLIINTLLFIAGRWVA